MFKNRIIELFRMLVFIFLIQGCGIQKERTLSSISSAKQLHQYFSYTKGAAPMISGHRGGVLPGFPENSIEAMEHTLSYTEAFFEIDPRLTKDSVVILMHDATLDRTTTASGKVADYTWEELKSVKLKDLNGATTSFSIPTLSETMEWARGKTVLNLDHKDVPFEKIADLIEAHKASFYVMLTVHSPEHARFYLNRFPDAMFSAHIKDPETFLLYEEANIPWSQMIAYIGSLNVPQNQTMLNLLQNKGVKVMVSTSPSADKLPTKEERAQAYREFLATGPDILESDFPLEVVNAIKNKD